MKRLAMILLLAAPGAALGDTGFHTPWLVPCEPRAMGWPPVWSAYAPPPVYGVSPGGGSFPPPVPPITPCCNGGGGNPPPVDPPAPVPLPAAFWLLGGAVSGLGLCNAIHRRRKKDARGGLHV